MAKKRIKSLGLLETPLNEVVLLKGWVNRKRTMGELIFIDLRDIDGVIQLVFNPSNAPGAYNQAQESKLEYILEVEGILSQRTPETINSKITTGHLEVQVQTCKILSVAKNLPFQVNDNKNIDENVRLRYRYLDLRRPGLQNNLKKRAQLNSAVRQEMEALDFLEIETPTLIKATPEGARDYLIPSRIHEGKFYALPQSPQLYKQLCMVGGLEKYYQLARCWRDEDLRIDRQAEFTQLDLEMSFVEEQDVMEVVEEVISKAWDKVGFPGKLTTPFKQISYKEAMFRYGSDKPDLRYSLELQDATRFFANTEFVHYAKAVKDGHIIKALVIPTGNQFNKPTLQEAERRARLFNATNFNVLKNGSSGFTGSLNKFIDSKLHLQMQSELGLKEDDAVILISGPRLTAETSLGSVRKFFGELLYEFNPQEPAILWVKDFPLFELNGEGNITPMHHPFTAPFEEDISLLDTNPLDVRATAYDLVLNGQEIGGGSIRITNPELQSKIFKTLGLSLIEAQEKFGFLLEAFGYGAPPHGGFAAGIERIVMEGVNAKSIRDVVAFPKNQQAEELMTAAPSTVEKAQLDELHIQLRNLTKLPKVSADNTPIANINTSVTLEKTKNSKSAPKNTSHDLEPEF